MSALGLALIGPGDVAMRDYLPELHRLGGRARLTVVCGRGPERARAAAERYGGRWTTELGEALAADDVDAVLNLTPQDVHGEITLAALRAGKHVYSEKPVAADVGEADRLAAEAAARGLVLVCAPSVLRFPQVVRAAEILRSGVLGRIATARGLAYGGVPPWGGYASDPTPFFRPESGPLVDMGVYPLHAVTGLLGPVVTVAALSARSITSFTPVDGPSAGRTVPVDVDDTWTVLLRLRDGVLVTIETNTSVHGSSAPELELLGRDGTLGLSLLDVSRPLVLSGADGPREEQVPHGRAAGPDHLLGVEHLVNCICDGTPPELDIGHARHVIGVIDAARRSAAEGIVVAVTDSPESVHPEARRSDGRS